MQLFKSFKAVEIKTLKVWFPLLNYVTKVPTTLHQIGIVRPWSNKKVEREKSQQSVLEPPTFYWDLLKGSFSQIAKNAKKVARKKVPPWALSLFRWARRPCLEYLQTKIWRRKLMKFKYSYQKVFQNTLTYTLF